MALVRAFQTRLSVYIGITLRREREARRRTVVFARVEHV